MNDSLEHLRTCKIYEEIKKNLLFKCKLLKKENWDFIELIGYNQKNINQIIKNKIKLKVLDLIIKDAIKDVGNLRKKMF